MRPRLLLLAAILLLTSACEPGGDGDDLPPDPDASPVRDCQIYLRVTPPPGAQLTEVSGLFTDWSVLPMNPVPGSDRVERFLGALAPGVYPYKFLFDGVWETPPPDEYTAFHDGIENRALYVGDCSLPSLRATSGRASADGSLRAVFRFTRAVDRIFLDPDSVWATVGGEAVEPKINVETGRIVVEAEDLPPGKHSVRVWAADAAGRGVEEGPVFLPLWVEPEPFDWADGPMYFVFLDRFRDGGAAPVPDIAGADFGGGYMGGDLVGALQAMEEGWFDQLGVRSIWLTPVYQNPDLTYLGSGDRRYTGYHGYWPVMGREVEDRLGTEDLPAEEALHAFIDAAHARGIRVLLDTVLNHVHESHEYTERFPAWFDADFCSCAYDNDGCDWDSDPLFCWFTDYLPDLDYRKPAVTQRMTDDLRWWLEVFDVDGFRVDAAKHMDHTAMRTASLRLRELYEEPGGAEIYLVGETFTGSGAQGQIMDYVAPWELDGQFDFPLFWPIRSGIGGGDGFSGIASELAASEAAYGEHIDRMSPFFGNHDVERYATSITGCDNPSFFGGCSDLLGSGDPGAVSPEQWDLISRISLSWALTASLRGVPLLYYGDELGLAGGPDPDNRRLMPWNTLTAAQRVLLDRMRAIGTARAGSTALGRGSRTDLWLDDELWVYARDAGDGQSAVVVLYLGDLPRDQDVYVLTGLDLEGSTVRDLIGGVREFEVRDGVLPLSLSPWEYLYLAR